jgi:hypothetical protein
MAAKYRKVDPRIWSDERFAALSTNGKLAVLYVLTCPEMNRIGLFRLSVATVAEAISSGDSNSKNSLSSAKLRKIRVEIERAFFELGWELDTKLRLIYLPNWWRYNLPDNPDAMKGALRDLEDIPRCALRTAFETNTKHLGKGSKAVLLAVTGRCESDCHAPEHGVGSGGGGSVSHGEAHKGGHQKQEQKQEQDGALAPYCEEARAGGQPRFAEVKEECKVKEDDKAAKAWPPVPPPVEEFVPRLDPNSPIAKAMRNPESSEAIALRAAGVIP